ncbi:MAG: YHS domain protein [Rhodobacteraceae bacterium]|nr:YHS domain protein [Paracoccaceae bacterium]
MPDRRQFALALAATLLAPALPVPARAQAVFAEGGLALRGYDPVAYFTEGAPRRGLETYSTHWQGAEWRFATAAHRAAFVADPAAHAPQYGGYCAWAVAEGYLAPVDPEAWAIVEGRLYLNFNTRIQRRWARDIPGFIARADANWPGLGG